MNIIYDSFLRMLNAGLTDRSETTKRNLSSIILSESQWNELFIISDEQELLPFIFDLCCTYNLTDTLEPSQKKSYQTRALQIAIRQITQTNEFLTIIQHAQEQRLYPIVLKGIVCRELYPQPCLRPSLDEDLLISAEEARAYHQFLLSEGLFEDHNSGDKINAVSELSYHKEHSPTYIEVHKTLFDPDSDVFQGYNEQFAGAFERTVHVQIEDVRVRTLAPTDLLLYQILHALKHFVHSGIGIRSVCDIGMIAEHYADDIDWNHIRKCLENVQAFDFTRGIFRIIQNYLLPDAGFFHAISWDIDKIDEEPLLEDILASGANGNSSMERLHSSNITLHAVSHGRPSSNAVFSSVFLPLDKMSGNYTYLKKAPFLLPVAWGQRIFGYLKERTSAKSDDKNRAAESIRLGRSRVELLQKYGIIQ